MSYDPMDGTNLPGVPEPATGHSAPPRPEPNVVGVFATHRAAETAVHDLRRAGFDMKRLSIVGKDDATEERAVGFYGHDGRMRVWGARAGFWGGLIGLLHDPALFVLPVVGHVFIMGPLTAALVSVLDNAAPAGGTSVLGAALRGIGVPWDPVLRFDAAARADRLLLVVHDTRFDVGRAAAVLTHAGADSVHMYGT